MGKDEKQLINLLPQEEFASSTVGRVLRWVLSTFRMIVVITEVVVMSAFLSRFYLDARISNLKQELREKTAVIKATESFEKRFRGVQNKIRIVSGLLLDENRMQDQIKIVSTLTPEEVVLTSFSFENNSTSIIAQTPTEVSISQMLANLKGSNQFDKIELVDIASADAIGIYSFSVDLKYKNN